MNGLLLAILIEIVAIIVLGTYLWICKSDSKENMCVCQGEGRENCRCKATRPEDVQQWRFLADVLWGIIACLVPYKA